MRGRTAAILTACLAAGLMAPGVATAGTLDQQQTGPDNITAALWAGLSGGQTFTPGLTGGLDQVDLHLQKVGAPAAYLTVEIRDVSGGVPGQAILAARNISASAITNSTLQFVPVTFNPPAPVSAGTQYAIVAYSAAPTITDQYRWGATTSDAYPGGAAFASVTPPSSTWTPISPPSDFVFKTYVVPAPPAPTPPVTTGPTGQRAAALAKCKHKHGKKRKRCKRRANLLPV